MQSKIDYTLFEGCTEGPWYVVTMRGWSGGDPVIGRRPQGEANTTVGDAPIAKLVRKASHWDNEHPVIANARLIAAAPILLAEHKALMEENERLREVLCYYADQYSWEEAGDIPGHAWNLSDDFDEVTESGGKRARAALNSMKGEG